MVVGAKVCELTEDLLWFVCGTFDVFSLLMMCGLRLEGNVSFLAMEGGKRCPPMWVYAKRVYTCMHGCVSREFRTIWVSR